MRSSSLKHGLLRGWATVVDVFDNADDGRATREIIRSRCGNVNFTMLIFVYRISHSGT